MTHFNVSHGAAMVGRFEVPLLGAHNVRNALGAIAVGAGGRDPGGHAGRGLRRFRGVKRRLEVVGRVNGVTVYDDFAHHPTAVAETLAGLRAGASRARVWAVFEPRSASSCRRVFQHDFARAFEAADETVLARVFRSALPEPERLSVEQLVRRPPRRRASARHLDSVDGIIQTIVARAPPGRRRADHVERRLRGHPPPAPHGPAARGPDGACRLSPRPCASSRSAIARCSSSSAPHRRGREPRASCAGGRARRARRPRRARHRAAYRRGGGPLRSAPHARGARASRPLEALLEGDGARAAAEDDAIVELPCCYGGAFGPDLPGVAAWARCSEAEWSPRHSARGVPRLHDRVPAGFPVPGGGRSIDRGAPARDAAAHACRPARSRLRAARRASTRSASPGGWQIVGRTPVRLFDPARTPPALPRRPGDAGPLRAGDGLGVRGARPGGRLVTHLVVRVPGLLTTVQDLGRWGHQAVGVPVGGAMDTVLPSRRERPGRQRADRPPRSRSRSPARCSKPRGRSPIALAGRRLEVAVAGRVVASAASLSTSRRADHRLRAPARRRARLPRGRRRHRVPAGARQPRRGPAQRLRRRSRAARFAAGDRLPIGSARGARGASRRARRSGAMPVRGGAALRVLPRAARGFADGLLDRLCAAPFVVSGESDRMGYRLEGRAARGRARR